MGDHVGIPGVVLLLKFVSCTSSSFGHIYMYLLPSMEKYILPSDIELCTSYILLHFWIDRTVPDVELDD